MRRRRRRKSAPARVAAGNRRDASAVQGAKGAAPLATPCWVRLIFVQPMPVAK